MPTLGLGDSLRYLITVFDHLLLRDFVVTRADAYNVLDCPQYFTNISSRETHDSHGHCEDLHFAMLVNSPKITQLSGRTGTH